MQCSVDNLVLNLELVGDPPVVLGVVGRRVDEVVRQDHRGEDRVAADETSADSMRGRGRI